MRCALRVSFYLAVLASSAWLLAGCQPKAAVRPPAQDSAVRDLMLQADAAFAEGHLHGWQRAEKLYAKASATAGSAETTEKLLLTRLLVVTRRSDEDIAVPDIGATVDAVCAAPVTGVGGLCDLARRYQEG